MMTRNLRTMGIAVVAILAMSAVVASAASARLGHFERSTSGGTALLAGTQVGTNVFSAGSHGNVECSVATFSGETAAKTTNEITVNPKYETCKFKGLNGTTVDVNGCSFEITGTTGDAHLQCPAGQSIVVTVKVTGIAKCTIHIGPQTVSKAVTFTNAGTAHPSHTSEVEVDLDATGITYTTTKIAEGAGTCASTTLGHDGSLLGNVKVKATNAGAHEGIWVT